jgi:hypothetical protein
MKYNGVRIILYQYEPGKKLGIEKIVSDSRAEFPKMINISQKKKCQRLEDASDILQCGKGEDSKGSFE